MVEENKEAMFSYIKHIDIEKPYSHTTVRKVLEQIDFVAWMMYEPEEDETLDPQYLALVAEPLKKFKEAYGEDEATYVDVKGMSYYESYRLLGYILQASLYILPLDHESVAPNYFLAFNYMLVHQNRKLREASSFLYDRYKNFTRNLYFNKIPDLAVLEDPFFVKTLNEHDLSYKKFDSYIKVVLAKPTDLEKVAEDSLDALNLSRLLNSEYLPQAHTLHISSFNSSDGFYKYTNFQRFQSAWRYQNLALLEDIRYRTYHIERWIEEALQNVFFDLARTLTRFNNFFEKIYHFFQAKFGLVKVSTTGLTVYTNSRYLLVHGILPYAGDHVYYEGRVELLADGENLQVGGSTNLKFKNLKQMYDEMVLTDLVYQDINQKYKLN